MYLIPASIMNIGNENLTIALVGYLIVFIALVILVEVFIYLPGLISMLTRIRLHRKGIEVPEQQKVTHITGEENAAIAIALYLFFNEMHDEESNIITIRKVSRTYSPWSSKIYGLNNLEGKSW